MPKRAIKDHSLWCLHWQCLGSVSPVLLVVPTSSRDGAVLLLLAPLICSEGAAENSPASAACALHKEENDTAQKYSYRNGKIKDEVRILETKSPNEALISIWSVKVMMWGWECSYFSWKLMMVSIHFHFFRDRSWCQMPPTSASHWDLEHSWWQCWAWLPQPARSSCSSAASAVTNHQSVLSFRAQIYLLTMLLCFYWGAGDCWFFFFTIKN